MIRLGQSLPRGLGIPAEKHLLLFFVVFCLGGGGRSGSAGSFGIKHHYQGRAEAEADLSNGLQGKYWGLSR